MAAGKFPNWARKLLTYSDAQEVSLAVREAEQVTRGEIVPVIVKSSTPTQSLIIPVTLLFIAFFGFLSLLYFPHYEPFSLIAAFLLAAICGVGLSRIPAVQRFFLLDLDEQKAVMERAELEFYRQGIHKTHERTGILIFVSVLERRVVVLADEGISALVPSETWDNLVKDLVQSVKKGRFKEGLTQSIALCGRLLSEKFPRLPTDTNELRNDLVIKE